MHAQQRDAHRIYKRGLGLLDSGLCLKLGHLELLFGVDDGRLLLVLGL